MRPWIVEALLTFATISFAEVAQHLGRPIFGRTYDPWDFVVYAAGALLAAAADRVVLPRVSEFWSGDDSTEGARVPLS